MTAEVAILNREAVAIAADSAVTIGGPGSKIYNTANKLFALSTVEPVAVMIYGADAFGTIPWETIVKEYRSQLASKSYATVEDYASKFLGYVSLIAAHLPLHKQRDQVMIKAQWELSIVRAAIGEALKKAASNGSPLDDGEIQNKMATAIEKRIDELKLYEPVEGINESIAGRQINTMIPDWSAFVDQSLVGIPINNEIRKRIRVMVRSSLRVISGSPLCSGIVVTGFGREQLLPAISHHMIDGIIAGKTLKQQLESVQIDEGPPAYVRAFAQGDMVATFMDGIHPVYSTTLEEYQNTLGNFFDRIIMSLLQYFEDRAGELLSEIERSDLVSKMTQMRLKSFEEFSAPLGSLKDRHSGQIMSVVRWLPKEELAEMAEALVNLTSFKRRVTPEAETVGGPIDVAVISKGDGLVWIKRKHYFEPELNHRYFYRDGKYSNVNIRKDSLCTE